jgi:hypothetical protein
MRVSILESSTPFFYYEWIKRELQTRPLNECRCDERLKTKGEESTRLSYTGLHGELEHPVVLPRMLPTRVLSYEDTTARRSLKYLFIMNQQSESERQNIYVGVGVMKDYNLTLRNLLISHTLSWSWSWNT